jgi:predicted metal-dependent hydrolase
MTDKKIEVCIREHYTAQNGEWLVEKGKVKEARLLKEACETIEKLRRWYETSERNYHRLMVDTSKRERDIEAREKDLLEREKRFEERKASFIRDFEKWV